MKSFLIAAAVVAATTMTIPVFAADVGISISIGDPNFYGRIDIGGYSSPRVINSRPIIIEHVMGRAPIYLRVPPGHIKNWGKHCRKYHACGERVYFVDDNWYHSDYAPHYQERHREHRQDRHEKRSDHHRKHKHNDNNGHGKN